MELLNRAPEPDVVDKVEQTTSQCLSDLPVMESFVRVLQPGRTRMVSVHVVLPDDYQLTSLGQLDDIRSRVQSELQKLHGSTFVDVIFTADRRWGAPLAELD